MSHLTWKQREIIGRDTLARNEGIVASTPNASNESTFVKLETLPPLDPSTTPNHPTKPIQVINDDAFSIARSILKRDPDAQGKVTVLNLASDQVPGGGWCEGSWWYTQEEALCYSSTLFPTLMPDWYPWANVGKGSAAGIYSPTIVVYKDKLANDCVDLPVDERFIVSVITAAAPRGARLTADGTNFSSESVLKDLRDKIRLIYRIAARNGQDRLILGAFGCGAYRCPPKLVATEMKNVLTDEEFKGRWKEVIFAVLSIKTDRTGAGNFGIFDDVMKGQLV